MEFLTHDASIYPDVMTFREFESGKYTDLGFENGIVPMSILRSDSFTYNFGYMNKEEKFIWKSDF